MSFINQTIDHHIHLYIKTAVLYERPSHVVNINHISYKYNVRLNAANQHDSVNECASKDHVLNER